MHAMRRPLFSIACAAALAAASLPSCGDSIPGPDGASASFLVTNQDASGHEHELEIFCSDLAKTSPVTYTATGPHEHTITLSVEELEALAAGEAVEISFTEGHAHRFVIQRPDGVC